MTAAATAVPVASVGATGEAAQAKSAPTSAKSSGRTYNVEFQKAKKGAIVARVTSAAFGHKKAALIVKSSVGHFSMDANKTLTKLKVSDEIMTEAAMAFQAKNAAKVAKKVAKVEAKQHAKDAKAIAKATAKEVKVQAKAEAKAPKAASAAPVAKAAAPAAKADAPKAKA